MGSVLSGRDRAYEYLRAELLSDPALPGTFINEQDVAEAVGVSRTPVREALLMLSAQHLVQLVPHRGAFVPLMTNKQIAEVFAGRRMIEVWCAREAIDKGCVPVVEMTQRLEFQRSLRDGDVKAFIEADRDFHAALISSTDNAVIEDMYEALRVRHVLIGVTAVIRPGASREDVLDEHQAILDGLAAADLPSVEAAIGAHLEATRRRLTGA